MLERDLALAELTGARLLVDQVTTARGARQPRVDQSRVLVTLTRGAGHWQLSRMRAF